jgi:predicted dehydrogenase
MTDHLRVAIVGCGYWGMNYVRLLSELSETEVVAVCDRMPDRLYEVKRRFPNVRMTTEVEDIASMEDVDAVIVCTSATTHYQIARCLLEAGKHILVEKPITTSVTHTEELIRLAEKHDVKLMVGHVFLFNPGIELVKTYIEQGELGKIYYLHACRTNLGPIRQDVNVLWDLATHDVSILNYLLDSVPQWVNASGAKVLGNNREDVGFVVLGYPSGVRGHIHVSWADPNKVREIVVVGSNTRIAFDDLSVQEKVRVYEKGVVSSLVEPASYGEYHLSIRDGNIVSPHVQISEPLKNQAKHFVQCVIEDCEPLTDGWSGLAVVRVMEAIDRSLAQNGTPIEIQWEDGYASRKKALARSAG